MESDLIILMASTDEEDEDGDGKSSNDHHKTRERDSLYGCDVANLSETVKKTNLTNKFHRAQAYLPQEGRERLPRAGRGSRTSRFRSMCCIFSAIVTNEKFRTGQSATVRLQSISNAFTLRVKWIQERRTCSRICSRKLGNRQKPQASVGPGVHRCVHPKPGESSAAPSSACHVSHTSPAVSPNALSKIPRPSTAALRLSY